MKKYEQRLPGLELQNMTLQQVINTLRSVAQTTDKE